MAKRPPRSQAPEIGATANDTKQRAPGRSRTKRETALASDTSTSPAGSVTFAERAEPSEEEIRLHAYHRYLQRGGGHGMDFEDWLEAERELKDMFATR